MLSRWPILESTSLTLPGAEAGDGSRTALFALLATPTGQLPFFTTQLSSSPGASALRLAQVHSLVRFVAEHADAHLPPVVTGDLNAEPASDEMRLLCGHLTAPVVADLVLVDAWRYAEPSEPAVTWDRANPHVRATHEPSARIDYVLVGTPRSGGAGRVLTARRFGDRPLDDEWPSDHAGVLVELGLDA